MTALHFYVTVQRIFSHWPSAGTQALCRYFGKGPFPPRGACRSCVEPNNVLCASIIAIYNYSNKNTYVNK